MNPAIIILRSYARNFGLIRFINFFRFRVFKLSQKYEERFGSVLLSSINPGDVVWDVGANLGFYTQQFLKCVGERGQVVAFEPAPACFDSLSKKFKNVAGVRLENAAMGSQEGTAKMRLENDPLASTHQILDETQDSGEYADHSSVAEVPIIRGDSYWQHNNRTPNVIKIDVEGYEEQVLHGMGALLKSPDVRSIFCEIHFSLLEKRGDKMAPIRIEELLKTSGFKTKWIDASHLQANRE